jgi:hypothetical protein
MKVELEGGNHAEVAAAAADGPEEIGVLRSAGLQDIAGRRDHLSREEVVDGQAVLSHQPAESSAESQAAMPVEITPPVVARPWS